MIGSFGDVIFEASEDQIVSLNNQISRSYKAKISEHQAIYNEFGIIFNTTDYFERRTRYNQANA